MNGLIYLSKVGMIYPSSIARGQFTIAEGLSRAKHAYTKEVIMVGIVLLIFYIVVHLKVWLSD